MSAWQRLQAGLQYNDFDPELFDLRVEAKRLFHAYNKTEDDETERRREILTRLLGHLGGDVWIEPDFRCEFGRNIRIGDGTYLNFGCTILAGVSVGEGSIIGAGSVVTKPVPAGVIAAGNPCRVIREITEADKTGYS